MSITPIIVHISRRLIIINYMLSMCARIVVFDNLLLSVLGFNKLRSLKYKYFSMEKFNKKNPTKISNKWKGLMYVKSSNVKFDAVQFKCCSCHLVQK